MSIFGVRTLDKLGSVIKFSETSVSVGQSKLMRLTKTPARWPHHFAAPLAVSQASWCKANM
jgi:hypothetical protein